MLTVESISFSFEHRQILRDLSLILPPGKLLHLRGPNGVGKSTLLSLLAGLLSPDRGSITFQSGKELYREDLREVCAWLPAEGNGLYLKMNAVENLRFWCQIRGKSPGEKELSEALSHWGLGHPLLKTRFPVSHYSTGMRRRLGLARLSLSGAPCWLLDEPIYGLDERGIRLFQDCLRDHLKNRGSAIVVSHDQGALSPLNPQTLTLEHSKKD